jgi:HEPN domain-containing protein
MKQTTNDWFLAAEDDLLSAIKLANEDRLSNVAAFHCQQCLEKAMKGVIEEKNLPMLKSHDLIRLSTMAEVKLDEQEIKILAIINEVYIDSRYPGDFGLMPNGKPTQKEITQFIQFTENLYTRFIQSIT